MAPFDLSDDGSLLVIERFDIAPDGTRLGFEDAASLMGQRVRDALSDRKYHGSYQRIATALKLINLPDAELARFFEQVAFTLGKCRADRRTPAQLRSQMVTAWQPGLALTK